MKPRTDDCPTKYKLSISYNYNDINYITNPIVFTHNILNTL